jgi:Na+-driven multidrug efflux pump
MFKVVLNFIFVAGFHMTVDGVGYATIAANLLSATLAFRTVYKMEGTLRFSWKNLRIFRRELGQILFTGIPVGVETALYSVANLAILATFNGYGPDATTGYTIASQFHTIIYYICTGASYAVMPYVAQNVGAGNLKRVRETMRKSVLLILLLGGGSGCLFAIFARPLASLMSQSPAVLDIAADQIVLVSALYFIHGIASAISAGLRGLGRPIVPTVSTMAFMCVLRFLWVWFVYPLFPNLVFLCTVWPVGWVLCTITTLCFYFPSMRRMEKQIS